MRTDSKPPVNMNIFNVGFVLLFFFVLFVSNPDEAGFKRYLKSSIQETNKSEGSLRGALMELVAGPSAWAIDLTTERQDYFFFSVYEIGVFDNKQKFVGVFGHFIPVKL